jgi:peptide chain release factor subunit 1
MTDSNDKLTALTKDQKFELKRKLTYLAKVKGSGTQLISVYIPAGYPLHEVTNKLRNELGQASNIKSKSTKINVMDALEKVIGYMKNLGKTPENGVAIFCGNVSQTHSKNDVQLFVIMPPVALNTQIYRCDSRFFLEPFERIISQTDIYGILAMDGRHATLAYLKGTQIEKLKELNSTAHSKIHVGFASQ